MSEPEPSTVRQLLHESIQALGRGERRSAHRLAAEAVSLQPELEEAWLALAAAASPKASLYYLQRALELNPHSQRAREGMEWAVRRIRKTGPSLAQLEAAADLRLPEPNLEDTQPVRLGDTTPVRVRPAASFRPLVIAAASLLCFALLALAFTAANSNWTSFTRSSSAERPISLLFKPSLTPTSTPTATPTNTPTPTPTATFTPTPTFTDTPTPTETPLPTDTPIPSDTPEPPTEEPSGPGPSIVMDGRWIDVDLTNQTVYAYENDTLVNTFIVSTGTWQHPTVTGTFKIYVKYRYADMSGPGYYLPNVPFTMYFYQGYGLHGTYWHHNFGHPMSHGCVNLQTDDAGWLYDWASVGTPVHVHN